MPQSPELVPACDAPGMTRNTGWIADASKSGHPWASTFSSSSPGSGSAYNAMLGGLAGILVAPVLFVTVGMGSSIALKAFAASIIGGFGNVTGAVVGGLALGVIETFGAAYVSVPYKDGFAFLVLFIFLLVRPQGIFGERISEKA
jgi:Branched-chain amino acid transport system / permease component